MQDKGRRGRKQLLAKEKAMEENEEQQKQQQPAEKGMCRHAARRATIERCGRCARAWEMMGLLQEAALVQDFQGCCGWFGTRRRGGWNLGWAPRHSLRLLLRPSLARPPSSARLFLSPFVCFSSSSSSLRLPPHPPSSPHVARSAPPTPRPSAFLLLLRPPLLIIFLSSFPSPIPPPPPPPPLPPSLP